MYIIRFKQYSLLITQSFAYEQLGHFTTIPVVTLCKKKKKKDE